MRMLERIAVADGSAAWVAAFGSANVYLAALPLDTQRVIYASGPDQVFAGGLYPIQPAVAAPGGWTVGGQWHFASGCKGADWIGVGIVRRTGGQRQSERRQATDGPFSARKKSRSSTTGTSSACRAPGSHDLRLKDKFVADPWTFVRGSGAVIDEPLYKYPSVSYQAEVHAAVNVGLARAALDLAAEMSGGTKTTTGAPRLADRAYFRHRARPGRGAMAQRPRHSSTKRPSKRGIRSPPGIPSRPSKPACCA